MTTALVSLHSYSLPELLHLCYKKRLLTSSPFNSEIPHTVIQPTRDSELSPCYNVQVHTHTRFSLVAKCLCSHRFTSTGIPVSSGHLQFSTLSPCPYKPSTAYSLQVTELAPLYLQLSTSLHTDYPCTGILGVAAACKVSDLPHWFTTLSSLSLQSKSPGVFT